MNTPRKRVKAGAVVLALAGTLTVISASTLASQERMTPLHRAAKAGDAAAATKWIAAGSDIEARTPEENATALYFAVAGNHHDVAQILLAAGADPNRQAYFAITALAWTAYKADVAMAKLLIEHGADVEGIWAYPDLVDG